jgi:hypothetical protein
MSELEPTEADIARWARWDDLRERKAKATSDEEREALAAEEETLRDEGIHELLEQDMDQTERWWWLSFIDRESETNLGVAIVRGGGIMEAAQNAFTIGCNPGGEVGAWPLSDEMMEEVDEQHRNRLLSEAELLEAGLIKGKEDE